MASSSDNTVVKNQSRAESIAAWGLKSEDIIDTDVDSGNSTGMTKMPNMCASEGSITITYALGSRGADNTADNAAAEAGAGADRSGSGNGSGDGVGGGAGGEGQDKAGRRGRHQQRASVSSRKEPVDLRKVSPIICTALWITLGISMIMFNKQLLAPRSQGGWNFGHPFFLTMLHQGFATFATILLNRYTPLLASVKENKLSTAAYWKNVAPLALFFSLGLVLGNSAYKYLSVSYIQMIKSCLPIPTLLMTYLMGREHPTKMQMFLVLVICVGAMMASLGEMNFSMIGFILQGCALCADVGRMLFLDQLTQEVRLDNLSTLYYMAPLACGFIFIGFLVFEYSTFHGTFCTYKDPLAPDPTADIIEYYPWWFPLLLLANAMLAFILNLSIVLLVTNAGIMFMTLAGIFKDVLVVIMSVFFFGAFSTVTNFQVVGYGVSLIGLTFYKELKKPDGAMTRWLDRVVHTLEQASRAEEEGLETTSITVIASSGGGAGTKRVNQKHGEKWVTRCMMLYKCIVAVTSCLGRICSRARLNGDGLAHQEDDELAMRAQVSTTHNGSSRTKEPANYIYKTLDVNDEEDDVEGNCNSHNSSLRSSRNNIYSDNENDEDDGLDDSDLNDSQYHNPFAPNFQKMKEEEYARSVAADMIFDAESS